MPGNRPSLLKATALWFAGALVGSVALFSIGRGGDPVGLAMITLLPWLFWLGPLYGAWRGRQALERFAEEIPEGPEASSPILGYPTLSWPERGFSVEARFRGPRVVALVLTVEGEGTVRFDGDRAREAARAALEGRIEHPDEHAQPPQ